MAGKKEIEALNAKIAASKVPEQLPVEKQGVVLVKVIMVKHSPLYHPYQRRWVPDIVDEPIEMVLDSWLQCQIEAGLVKVV